MFKKSNQEKNNKRKSKKQLKTNQEETELWHTTYIDIWNDVKSKIDVTIVKINQMHIIFK